MPGGGRLTLSVGESVVDDRNTVGLPAGSYIRLTAADTGIGMDRATLARATEPFFSTKGVGKGTGLGLSMVHGLAAQSGGTLRLTSEPGREPRSNSGCPQRPRRPSTWSRARRNPCLRDTARRCCWSMTRMSCAPRPRTCCATSAMS
ncbi:ATP-binding protein [Sphingomonas aurantiaca]|uniref:ATP-binding protein n=1 Tax=Sphingomonas aurantiaca TaxID=185949 RepID=UPI002FDF6C1F